jgi:hypothetical protein
MTKYRCSNDGCGVERTSKTDLAVYGTCKECGVGVMRRVLPTCTCTLPIGSPSLDAKPWEHQRHCGMWAPCATENAG